MTPEEAFAIGKEAVAAVVLKNGAEYKFPFDEIWEYAKTDVPSLSRPAVAQKLVQSKYIEETGEMTSAKSLARAGSKTPEYRPGSYFAKEGGEADDSAQLWSAASQDLDKTISEAGLIFPTGLSLRLSAALLAKPFVILAGLSGSGKTKLAQAFVQWLCVHNECSESEQYVIQAVGADWTNREPLLGYPDALAPGDYRMPNSGTLNLILRAINNPVIPYFLILDEMNLSHVERYFADFLSAMEARQLICLHENIEYKDKDWGGIPDSIILPPNLFIIGTINVDETTYMFSPKVLDRAHVIEFSVSKTEMSNFLDNPRPIDLSSLTGKGVAYAQNFVKAAANKTTTFKEETISKAIQSTLKEMFDSLASIGAEFGYRTAYEISRFVFFYKKLTGEKWKDSALDSALDAAIMQKILPKLHGSKTKLDPVLTELRKTITKEKFPISFAKLERMGLRLKQNGFTSYAEA